MKVKVMALIFIVAFAAIATPALLRLSSSQTAEENVDFTRSYSTLQMDDNEVVIEPLEELDTPEMPG